MTPRQISRSLLLLSLLTLLLSGANVARAAATIERVVSPQGIEAWLVEDHSNPIISLSLAFRGGAALDPAGKVGLAHMVSGLLDEGAGELTSQQFQHRLDEAAISLSFDADLDQFRGSLRTLSHNRDEAFTLLHMALSQPRFDAEPVERVRRQIISALRSDQQDPDSVANSALFTALFPDHPYGRPADGLLGDIDAITAADLHGFVSQRFARNALVLGVVGDITAEQLMPLLDRTFGTLPATATPWDLPEATVASHGDTEVIHRDVPQSALRFAQRGLKRDDDDFYPAYVLNYILGGGSFASRLFAEVREKRGLAYSISSALIPLDHAAVLLAAAGTAEARTPETIQVVRQQWQHLAQTGVTQQELDDAKTYLTGSFHLRFSSSGAIAQILVSMQLENLGMDFLERRNALVEAVTLEQVNRIAKTLLSPDQLVVVRVGRS